MNPSPLDCHAGVTSRIFSAPCCAADLAVESRPEALPSPITLSKWVDDTRRFANLRAWLLRSRPSYCW